MPLEARSFDEDFNIANTLHRPCWGNAVTVFTTICVKMLYTVVLGWQMRATTCGRMVKNYKSQQLHPSERGNFSTAYHDHWYSTNILSQLAMHIVQALLSLRHVVSLKVPWKDS